MPRSPREWPTSFTRPRKQFSTAQLKARAAGVQAIKGLPMSGSCRQMRCSYPINSPSRSVNSSSMWCFSGVRTPAAISPCGCRSSGSSFWAKSFWTAFSLRCAPRIRANGWRRWIERKRWTRTSISRAMDSPRPGRSRARNLRRTAGRFRP